MSQALIFFFGLVCGTLVGFIITVIIEGGR